MRTLAPAAAVLVAAALLAAGCGGSDDSETSEVTVWAGQVCTELSGWAEVLASAASGLRGGNVSQESLQAAADDVKTATDTLVEDLKELPRPDTEAGQEAKESVDQLADELEEDADTIESTVDDVSGASDVPGAVSTVSATLATMGNQVTSTLDDLRQLDAQGELEAAVQDAVPCQEISGEIG